MKDSGFSDQAIMVSSCLLRILDRSCSSLRGCFWLVEEVSRSVSSSFAHDFQSLH